MALRSSEITIHSLDRQDAVDQLDASKLPQHLAVVMDGNGRWAAARGLTRIEGHRAGGEAVRRIVEAAARMGVGCLTLYAFSTENWKRSKIETRALMDLLTDYLRTELPRLRQHGIQFRMIGAPEGLPISVLEQIRRVELSTFQNSGMRLNIALNYGGRDEIVHAVQRVVRQVACGQLDSNHINEQEIARNLFTRDLPDPDLIIRTSGEMRISNFLLWQSAYSEFYVTDTLWPDFDEPDLLEALSAYQRRDRRFGGVKSA
jgi:undecaprenyl diphosphate synthase